MNCWPCIGITTLSYEVNPLRVNWFVRSKCYDRAVIKAGGLPVSIPAFAMPEVCARYLDMVDGVLFIGGADIPPMMYGQTEIRPEVQLLEASVARNHLMLAKCAFERKLPLFGICLGSQILNVSCNGKLIQHLDDLTALHRSASGDQYHNIRLEPDSKLADIFGTTELRVNSCHHQAIDPSAIGEGWRVAAWADHQVVEAIEFPGEVFRIGVQWHPERIDDEEHRRMLFSAFVASC